MENRAKTSAVEQQQYQQQQYQQQYSSNRSSSLYKDDKSWEEGNNALHHFPTHPDLPQGNARDGKDEISHHENAQRGNSPRREATRNGNRPDGNGADFEDVPQSTSSRVEKTRAMMGLRPEAPIVEEHDNADHADLRWAIFRGALKEPFAEFFGTLILVAFGNGSVAQVMLSAGETAAPGGNGFGEYQSINWGWGLGVMLGIYVAGDSGAYLNPALTFTNCVLRKLPWRRFPIYFIAQLLGGFVGSGIVYANYINKINTYEGGAGIRTVPPAPKATAGLFCTFPQGDLTKASQFFSEFIASAFLMFVIFALKDDSNKGSFSASGSWFPLALFFLVFGLGASFGWETGYAINLARDFGPRLMAYALGYGNELWSAGGYYFWIPMVAPFCGALFGGVMYDIAIYTGPSPINTPYFGLKKLLLPHKAIKDRVKAQEKDALV
ncbi:related to channel proteins [Ramularia collo-cygni]|uniref:Related to channel proteins n=1 Tax=Ramularia collo-cygni TaxID=112498 RepID=A0A2D3VIB7_9PEZI|nr:related to channel proteins [Ramularia collo-cygni]CZT22959.1 related to channel proteins [Ramularia collo-cygni]